MANDVGELFSSSVHRFEIILSHLVLAWFVLEMKIIGKFNTKLISCEYINKGNILVMEQVFDI